MIKLANILKEVEQVETGGDAQAKARVEEELASRLSRALSGSSEDRFLMKIKKDIATLEGKALRDYLYAGFMNKNNSWGNRLVYDRLVHAFDDTYVNPFSKK